MATRSPKFQLIEDRLGSDLAGFIRERRDRDVSYENVARELWATTGVDVTAQTIANWDGAHSPTSAEAGAA